MDASAVGSCSDGPAVTHPPGVAQGLAARTPQPAQHNL